MSYQQMWKSFAKLWICWKVF